MGTRRKIGRLVLAAGAGRRFGGVKQLAPMAARRPRSAGGPLDVDGFAPDAASEAAFARALAGAAQPARAFLRRHELAVLVHLTGDATRRGPWTTCAGA